VIEGRPMAVLTLYDRMRGHRDAFILIRVAGLTVIRTLILDGHLFPILDVGLSVPSIHISPLMDTETFGDIEESGDKDKSYKTEYYPERPQDMTFHRLHLIN
jgi:hypothetical protein